MFMEMIDLDSFNRISVTGVLFLLTCLLWFYHQLGVLQYRGRPLPPGSFGLPIIGETISLARQKVEFFRTRRRKFGDVFKTHLFFRPTVRASGTFNLRFILKGDNKILKSVLPSGVRTIFGKGALSVSQGASHSNRKRKFMQALTGKSLKSCAPEMAAIIEETLMEWGEPHSISLCKSVEVLTLNLVLSSLYGRHISKEDLLGLSDNADVIVDNLFSVPLNVPGTAFHKAMAARHKLEKFAEKYIAAVSSTNHYTPLMECALDSGGCSEQLDMTPDLRSWLADISIELIVAGRGAMFSTTILIVLLLKKYPTVLKKLREELVLNSLDDAKAVPLTSVGIDRLQNLTYLDHVLKEVLRVFPPVGGGYRMAKESFELDGYYIPKDWTVSFSIRETHHHQPIPDCGEFDPDRWEKTNPHRPDKERYAYIPFGAGSRSCPGKEFAKTAIKLTTLQLIRSYDWSILDQYKLVYYPTPRPEVEVPVQFTEIKSL